MFRLVITVLFWTVMGLAGVSMFGTLALCGWDVIMSGAPLNPTGEVAHPVAFTWAIAVGASILTPMWALVCVHGVDVAVHSYKFCKKHNLVY